MIKYFSFYLSVAFLGNRGACHKPVCAFSSKRWMPVGSCKSIILFDNYCIHFKRISKWRLYRSFMYALSSLFTSECGDHLGISGRGSLLCSHASGCQVHYLLSYLLNFITGWDLCKIMLDDRMVCHMFIRACLPIILLFGTPVEMAFIVDHATLMEYSAWILQLIRVSF